MPKFDVVNLKRLLRRGMRRTEKAPARKLLVQNTLQVAAMWGIAVVQPILGILGENTETFLKFRITGRSVLLLALLFTFVPPILALIVEAVLLRVRKALHVVHLGAIGALGLVTTLQVAKFYLKLEGSIQVLVAVLLAAGLVLAAASVRGVGDWLRILAVVPLIAVTMFVFNSPAGRYARGAKVEAYEVKTGNTPIFYVMFDEFPVAALLNKDGTIDADRFPNFARLASTSTWYRNFTTTAETTDLSVPAAMSGTYPKVKQSFTYVDHPDNLFTWLGGSYKMNSFEFLSEMCPPNVCSSSNAINADTKVKEEAQWRGFASEMRDVFGQRLDLTKENEYDAVNAAAAQTDTAPVVPTSSTSTTTTIDSTSTTTSGEEPVKVVNIPFLAQIQPGRWQQWLDAIPEDPTGTLNFIHSLLPHQSWVFYPDGSPYQLVGQEQFEGETVWETKVREQRMILQTQFVDKLVGMLLDKLESNDAYKNSLVVIQADHGVSLDPGYSHRFISGDYANAPDIIYAPLFIHAPGQTKGVISDANVENIDVLPIMADLLNTEVPWEMDGMLPEEKKGKRAQTKTVILNPKPYDIAPRPEKLLTYDAKEIQQAMFARIPDGADATNYLDMLYGDTPHHGLIGTELNIASLPTCECELKIDSDLAHKDNPLLYIRGDAPGLSDGDWVAFLVHGRISGLSQVFTRDGKTMYATLVYREDYGDDWSIPTAALIDAQGQLVQQVPLN